MGFNPKLLPIDNVTESRRTMDELKKKQNLEIYYFEADISFQQSSFTLFYILWHTMINVYWRNAYNICYSKKGLIHQNITARETSWHNIAAIITFWNNGYVLGRQE